MAILLERSMPNGAQCGYHRVDELVIHVGTHDCEIVVGAYVGRQHAARSRTPCWRDHYQITLTTLDVDGRAEAYTYLKGLPVFAGGVDG